MRIPIRSCSRRGLPCRPGHPVRGGLLPHPFTLAAKTPKGLGGGLLSVALSLGSPPAGVTRRLVTVEPGLSSTAPKHGGDRPAVWPNTRGIAAKVSSSTRREPQKRDQPGAGLAVGHPVDPLLPPVALERPDDRRRRWIVSSAGSAVVTQPGEPGLQGEDTRPLVALAERCAGGRLQVRPTGRVPPPRAASRGTARPDLPCGRARRRSDRGCGRLRSPSANGYRRPGR